jgi:hypothetical protein
MSMRGGAVPGIDARPHQAVGEMIAEHALGRLQPGGHLMVINRDASTFKNPASDYQMAAFKSAIARRHGRIDRVLLLQADPIRPIEVPPGDFLEIIKKVGPGSVIVSFMGPPILSDAQRQQLPAGKPAIIAFCPGALPDNVDLNPLFEQGLVQEVVVSRRQPQTTAHGGDLRTCFDAWFLAITPANLGSLASR